jgi:hypothetical protein
MPRQRAVITTTFRVRGVEASPVEDVEADVRVERSRKPVQRTRRLTC